MSAQINPSQSSLVWRSNPEHSVHQPGEKLISWLAEKGVLTIRMKESSPEPFRLQLLDSTSGQGQMLNADVIRRVILWSGDIPCIYAESYLPRSAQLALPGLRNLGGAPLGEFLNSHPDISRGKLEFALLSSPRLPTPIEYEAHAPLWARKAKYSVGDSSLIVAELFLPGINSL